MLPPMEEFFNGKSIFITGASGFVGKVLVEKLLRSLPGIATIFLLIRPLKGLSGASRWHNIENTVLFSQIRKKFPERLGKVEVIEGDISVDDFGMFEEDLKRVLAEASVVFHCAATVRFDEKLKKAADMNIRGVRRMVELCRRMPKLEAFFHCSTAFVNSDKPGESIAEMIYPVNADAHKLLTALENLDDSHIDLISDNLTKGFPNTYCFTKALGEQIIDRDAIDLPALIFRPSIISPVWQDGIPGWADAFQGLTAIIGVMYAGAIPRFPMLSVNPKTILDCVPIDVVTSMMIVCAGHRMSFSTDTIPVYHCCTSDLNPFMLMPQVGLARKYMMRYPAERLLFPPSPSLRGFQCVESVRHQMRAEYLGPALDRLACCFCQKPMWTRVFAKLRSVYDSLIPFSQYYHFELTSMTKLTEMLTDEDKKNFNFDVTRINWNDYSCNLIVGLKTFLLKDDIVDNSSIRRSKINLFNNELLWLLPFYALCNALIATVSGIWHVMLPILLIGTLYTLKDWFLCTKIKSLVEYREEVEAVIGERIRSKKDEKQIV